MIYANKFAYLNFLCYLRGMKVSMKDLFFPHCCPICDDVIESQQVICDNCLADLPRTEQATMRGNMTEGLFMKEAKFVRGAAFLFFEKDAPVQNLLHKMKYGMFANPLIGYALAKEAAYEFMQSDFFDGIDVLLPVPLHPKRLRERGFNQAEWICKGLSDVTGIPMDTTHLTRILNNAHQAQTAGEKRSDNVKNIFAVNHPEELFKKHVLLVDDIITTGATLQACIDVLRPIRKCHFSVFGIGKTR